MGMYSFLQSKEQNDLIKVFKSNYVPWNIFLEKAYGIILYLLLHFMVFLMGVYVNEKDNVGKNIRRYIQIQPNSSEKNSVMLKTLKRKNSRNGNRHYLILLESMI